MIKVVTLNHKFYAGLAAALIVRAEPVSRGLYQLRLKQHNDKPCHTKNQGLVITRTRAVRVLLRTFIEIVTHCFHVNDLVTN